MNKPTAILVAFLIILSLGLATDTVTQHLASARAAAKAAGSPPKPGGTTVAEAGCCSTPTSSFPDVTVKADQPTTKLVGDWVNSDASHPGLTRLTIGERADGLFVKPWALSGSGEKPYGDPRKLAGDKNPWDLNWEAGFAESKMRLALMDDGRLRVDSVALVMDPAQTKNAAVTDYLKKATPEDLRAHENQAKLAATKIAKAEGQPKSGGT